MSSSAWKISFVQDDAYSDEELDDSGEEDSGEHTIETYEQNMAVDNKDLDSTEENPVLQEAPENKCKTVVTPHKK